MRKNDFSPVGTTPTLSSHTFYSVPMSPGSTHSCAAIKNRTLVSNPCLLWNCWHDVFGLCPAGLWKLDPRLPGSRAAAGYFYLCRIHYSS